MRYGRLLFSSKIRATDNSWTRRQSHASVSRVNAIQEKAEEVEDIHQTGWENSTYSTKKVVGNTWMREAQDRNRKSWRNYD